MRMKPGLSEAKPRNNALPINPDFASLNPGYALRERLRQHSKQLVTPKDVNFSVTFG